MCKSQVVYFKLNRTKPLMFTLRSCAMLGVLLASGLPLTAQLDPENAQVMSYFPQLADGGAASQQWTTALTFVNPHGWLSSNATAYFYKDDGKPLPLDFGAGPASSFKFTVGPQATVTYNTTGQSVATQVGWAIVTSSLPLQGVVQFSYSVNGVPQQGVSSQSTAASTLFRSPATTSTGIAVANTYSNVQEIIRVTALDSVGHPVGSSSLTLAPFGHRSFTLGELMPSLGSSFRGTVLLENPDTFVAWALSGDSGVLSSYPPAGLNWPVSQYERILKVWFKVLNAAVDVGMSPAPKLVIDYTGGQLNSSADTANNAVHLYMNLAEFISDSESELAFVMGHELGHFLQRQTGQSAFVPTDAEQDADEFAVALSLSAGYDPYGGAGALGKLTMASAQAGVVAQNFDNLTTDPHTSFSKRLSVLMANLQTLCVSTTWQSVCSALKEEYHPDLPTAAPLMVPRRVVGPAPFTRAFGTPPALQPPLPGREKH
jgi:hypothetical protein